MNLIDYIGLQGYGGAGGEPGRSTLPESGAWHPEEYFAPRKKARPKMKADSAGTQTEGGAGGYGVEVGGRLLHTGLSLKDAKKKAAAVTYGKVVWMRGDDQKIRERARKQLADKGQAKIVRRKSVEYPSVEWARTK